MRAFLFAATVAAALVIGFGIGLAADPPAAADKSLWQAIKDDPRAVAALVGAFAGFTLGVLIKFGFDLWLDWIRRQQARRDLAAELHAEIGWVMKRVRNVVEAVRKTCPTDTADDEDVNTQRWDWDYWQAPSMAVREAHIGRLGTLPQAVARLLIRIGGQADWLDRRRMVLLASSDEKEFRVSAGSLHSFARTYMVIMHDLIGLNEPLAKIGGVKPHDWAKAKAELAAEAERAAEAKLAEAPPGEEEPAGDDAET